jgi:retinoid hydroxylase
MAPSPPSTQPEEAALHPLQILAAAGVAAVTASLLAGLAHPASSPALAAALPAHVSPHAVGFGLAAVLVSLWLPLVAPASKRASTTTTTRPRLPRPPAAGGIPWIGDTFKSLADAKATRDARHAQLGDVFSAWFAGHKFISVRGAKTVKALLNAEHVSVETQWPWRVRDLLGPHSISTTHFAAHTALRKALAPAFGPAAVAGYVPLMQRVCEEHVAAWAGAGPGLSGVAAAKSFTFHVITHVLGFHDGAHWAGPATRARASALFADWLGGFHPTGSALPGGGLWKARRARATLLAGIRDTLVPMIAARVARVSGGGGGGDGEHSADGGAPPAHVMDRVVDALLAERAATTTTSEAPDAAAAAILTPAADIALNLLFAGTDTSSTVLTLLLRSLAADPALTARLRAEQAAAVAAHGPDLSAAALESMPLLSAAIKEQARTVPVVGQVFRTVVVDSLEVGGYEVRKGETLVLDLAHTLQTDARWAGADPASPAAPSKFYPDRWIPGAPGAPVDPDALKREGGFIPFGGGPRLCVGYRLALSELLCMLSVILRRLEWTVASPDCELVKPPNGLPLPTDGFIVEFRALGGGVEQ